MNRTKSGHVLHLHLLLLLLFLLLCLGPPLSPLSFPLFMSLFDWESHTHSYVLTYLVVVLTEGLYIQCFHTCSPEVTLYLLCCSHIAAHQVQLKNMNVIYGLIFLLFHICYINEFNEYVLKTFPIFFSFVVVGVTSRGQGLCTWFLYTKNILWLEGHSATVPHSRMQGCADDWKTGTFIQSFKCPNARTKAFKQ